MITKFNLYIFNTLVSDLIAKIVDSSSSYLEVQNERKEVAQKLSSSAIKRILIL